MLLVPNHHVVVPKVEELVLKMPYVVQDPDTRRQAHVQHLTVNSVTSIALDFTPTSDLWIEVYINGYRLINPRYATHLTRGVGYETYNYRAPNQIVFNTPITGNVTIVCDTLPQSLGESLHLPNIGGMTIYFENIQSYDVFEKHFTPSRYPMPALGLEHTVIRVRIADALYSAPVILRQPCYGQARISADRKSIVYIPRVGFQGWDVFGYTLMSQRGQMGKPAAITVRVGGEDIRYNWAAQLDGNSLMSIREIKNPYLSVLGGRETTIEFYYFTASVAGDKNFRVGIFGQYRDDPVDGRYAIYLQGTGVNSRQVVVFQYCISSVDVLGNPVYLNYKLSSKARLEQGKWHHVVVQIDARSTTNTTVTMYLDGWQEIFYSNDFTSQTVSSNDYFLIGAVNDRDQSQKLNGYISNFRLIDNQCFYSGSRISVPRRPLAITANTKIMTLTNGIQDPVSIQDMYDLTRIQKVGNVEMVEPGPFSPVVLSADKHIVRHGDTIRITHSADYICTYSFVPWTINANVSVGAVNQDFVTGAEPVFLVQEVDQVSVTARSAVDITGNFIIDDVDTVLLTVDSHSNPMICRHTVDFYLDNHPLMLETFDVYSDYNGLVMHIEASNDGFARDLVNFEHGTLTSLGAYNPSLGGYFQFNGTSDVVTGTSNPVNNITGDITCEVWFRIQTAPTGNVCIFNKGDSYGLYYSAVADEFYYRRVGIEGNVEVIHSAGSAITSAWYQLVGISSGVEHKLYLNNVKVAEITRDYGPYPVDSSPYKIGYSGIGSYHNGQVSIVRLYDRALTSSDVQTNFDEYRSRYGL